MTDHVPLTRRFAVVDPSDSADDGGATYRSYFAREGWDDVCGHHRVVILAGAGAGKTHEMRGRAERMAGHGARAFFIRIEDIDAQFDDAFEVGDAAALDAWLTSTDEAWFFLASVDEARLARPRALDKALRVFGRRIQDAMHRAHVILSSRPHAWRETDGGTMLAHLPWPSTEKDPQPKVRQLVDLSEEDIRTFATHRSAERVDVLMDALTRAQLMDMASRPFDLDGILVKWRDDRELGGRLDLMRHMIAYQLRETDPDRHDGLAPERAMKGARYLAAAVILTGEPAFRVPDGAAEGAGLEATALLLDWTPEEIGLLLGRGLFGAPLYGRVRFRHRAARELVAAEWFAELLDRGTARMEIAGLILREQHGETIVTPRLRPILPWLCLFDDDLRSRVVQVGPEVLLEGGDVARLPLVERAALLRDVVARIATDDVILEIGGLDAVVRIATPDLAEVTVGLIADHARNDEVLSYLARLVWQGEMTACLPALQNVAADVRHRPATRADAIRAVMSVGTAAREDAVWDAVLACEGDVPAPILSVLAAHARTDAASIERMVTSLARLEPGDLDRVTELSRHLVDWIDRMAGDGARLIEVLYGLRDLLGQPPYDTEVGRRLSRRHFRLLPLAGRVVEHLIEARHPAALSEAAIDVIGLMGRARRFDDRFDDDPKSRLAELVPRWPELNDEAFWTHVVMERAARVEKGEALRDAWLLQLDGLWSFGPEDVPRLIAMALGVKEEDDALVALSQAKIVLRQGDLPLTPLSDIAPQVAHRPDVAAGLSKMIAPPDPEVMAEQQRRNDEFEESRAKRQRKKDDDVRRAAKILRANPDRIRNPKSFGPGELTSDRVYLLDRVRAPGGLRNTWGGAEWRTLVPDFGPEVARAYRDAAVACRRAYDPPSKAERDEPNSTPTVLVFGLAGLEIEAADVPDLFAKIDDVLMRRAVRYATWELNGFPTWLEVAHRSRPGPVVKTLAEALKAELAASANEPSIGLLHDVCYHTLWLQRDVAEAVLDGLSAHPCSHDESQKYALRLLRSADVDPVRLAAIAGDLLARGLTKANQTARLHALWVDADANRGLPTLEAYLGKLSPDAADDAFQRTLVALTGGRRGEGGPRIGTWQTVDHLETLHRLADGHIRRDEDIERLNGGVYSPGLRDDAQDARNGLITALCAIPGRPTYDALVRMADGHPVAHMKPRLRSFARRRAEQDGDLTAWTEAQVAQFHRAQTIKPATNRQLFDVVRGQILALKDWLERGDDSPYRTWAVPRGRPRCGT